MRLTYALLPLALASCFSDPSTPVPTEAAPSPATTAPPAVAPPDATETPAVATDTTTVAPPPADAVAAAPSVPAGTPASTPTSAASPGPATPAAAPPLGTVAKVPAAPTTAPSSPTPGPPTPASPTSSLPPAGTPGSVAAVSTPAATAPVADAGAESISAARRAVEAIYTVYAGAGDPPELTHFASGGLKSRIRAAEDYEEAKDTLLFTFDPVVNAEEALVSDVSTTGTMSGEKVKVVVSFKNLGKAQKLTYTMVKEGENWKVGNISSSKWDLWKLLTVPASP